MTTIAHAVRFLLAAATLALMASAAVATEVAKMEVRSFDAPGGAESFVFVFVGEGGMVTRTSVSEANTFGYYEAAVPTATSWTYVLNPRGHEVCFLNPNSSAAGTHDGFLPLLEGPAGPAVLPATSFEHLLSTEPLSVLNLVATFAGGTTSEPLLSEIVVRAPDVAFREITDEQFADVSVFPLFSGVATVVEVLEMRVTVVPEPGAAGLFVCGLILLAARRTQRRVSNVQRHV